MPIRRYDHQNPFSEVTQVRRTAEDALISGALDELAGTIARREDDELYADYDPRRRLSIEGVYALKNALSSVGSRRDDVGFTDGVYGSLGALNDMLEFRAGSDEAAILGMQQLIEGHIAVERQKWQQASAMIIPGGELLSRLDNFITGNDIRKWEYREATKEEYYWRMRHAGYTLALQAIGIRIGEDSNVTAVNDRLAPAEVCAAVDELPDLEDFIPSVE